MGDFCETVADDSAFTQWKNLKPSMPTRDPEIGIRSRIRNYLPEAVGGGGWDMWGNPAAADYEPDWKTYANHTVALK